MNHYPKLKEYAKMLISDDNLAEDLIIETLEILELMIKEGRVSPTEEFNWALLALRESYYSHLRLMNGKEMF